MRYFNRQWMKHMLPVVLGFFLFFSIYTPATKSYAASTVGFLNVASEVFSKPSFAHSMTGFSMGLGLTKLGFRSEQFAYMNKTKNLSEEEAKKQTAEFVLRVLLYDLSGIGAVFSKKFIKRYFAEGNLSKARSLVKDYSLAAGLDLLINSNATPYEIIRSYARKYKVSLKGGSSAILTNRMSSDDFHKMKFQVLEALNASTVTSAHNIYEHTIDGLQNATTKEVFDAVLQNPFLGSDLADLSKKYNIALGADGPTDQFKMALLNQLDTVDEQLLIANMANKLDDASPVRSVVNQLLLDPSLSIDKNFAIQAKDLFLEQKRITFEAIEQDIFSLPDSDDLKRSYKNYLKANKLNPNGAMINQVRVLNTMMLAVDVLATGMVIYDLVESIKSGNAEAIAQSSLGLASSVLGIVSTGLAIAFPLSSTAGVASVSLGIVSTLIIVAIFAWGTASTLSKRAAAVNQVQDEVRQYVSNLMTAGRASVDQLKQLEHSALAMHKDDTRQVAALTDYFNRLLSFIIPTAEAASADPDLSPGKQMNDVLMGKLRWKHTVVMNAGFNLLNYYGNQMPEEIVVTSEGDSVMTGTSVYKLFQPDGVPEYRVDLSQPCNVAEPTKTGRICAMGQPAPPISGADIMYPFLMLEQDDNLIDAYEIRLETSKLLNPAQYWEDMVNSGISSQPDLPSIYVNAQPGDVTDAVMIDEVPHLDTYNSINVNTHGGDDLIAINGMIGGATSFLSTVSQPLMNQLQLDAGEGIDELSLKGFMPAEAVDKRYTYNKLKGIYFDASRTSNNFGYLFIKRVGGSITKDVVPALSSIYRTGNIAGIEGFTGSSYHDVIKVSNELNVLKESGTAHYVLDLQSPSDLIGAVVHDSRSWGAIHLDANLADVNMVYESEDGHTNKVLMNINVGGATKQFVLISDQMNSVRVYLNDVELQLSTAGTVSKVVKMVNFRSYQNDSVAMFQTPLTVGGNKNWQLFEHKLVNGADILRNPSRVDYNICQFSDPERCLYIDFESLVLGKISKGSANAKWQLDQLSTTTKYQQITSANKNPFSSTQTPYISQAGHVARVTTSERDVGQLYAIWRMVTVDGLTDITDSVATVVIQRDEEITIDANQDLRQLDNNPEALRHYVEGYNTVKLVTSDGNWTPTIVLPDGVAKGSVVNLWVRSTWGVNVRYNGSEQLKVLTGQQIGFVYDGTSWERIREDEVTVSRGYDLRQLENNPDALRGYVDAYQQVNLVTSDGNWTKTIALPDGAPKNSEVTLWVRSSWGVYVKYNGSEQVRILTGQRARFVYDGTRWERMTPRWLSVQLNNTNVLSLAEVQVFNRSLQNIAVGKPTSQNTTISGGVSSRAVDGNTNGKFGQYSVTATSSISQPRWTVSLGEIGSIAEVKLWNRTDCCASRLSDFYVLETDFDPAGKSLSELLSMSGVRAYHHAGTAGTTTHISGDALN